MKERIRKSILAILAAVALITTVACIYSAEYVGAIACAVALASVVSDLVDPKQTEELTKEDEKAIEDDANAVVMLCAYKIPKKVIECYSEDYPYFVVAEKPTSTEVEYWWAGDKEANDLVHSRVADKYKQLGHYVIANAVKGEVHHG